MTELSRLKVGDIIDLSFDIEEDFGDADVENLENIDPYDFKRTYHIVYYLNNDIICFFYQDCEPGECSSHDDKIEEFIKEDLPKSFEEIAEYEIFAVDNKYWNSQHAKIKIKALK